MKKASKSLFINDKHKLDNIQNVIKQVSESIDSSLLSNLLDNKQYMVINKLSESFTKIYKKYEANRPEYINSFNKYIKSLKEAVKPQIDIELDSLKHIKDTISEVKKITSNEPMYDNLIYSLNESKVFNKPYFEIEELLNSGNPVSYYISEYEPKIYLFCDKEEYVFDFSNKLDKFNSLKSHINHYNKNKKHKSDDELSRNVVKAILNGYYDQKNIETSLDKAIKPIKEEEELEEQPAYAGSRVDYDKPSLDYIGSGEGNQAHGWGLYYAQDKDVADAYRINFTNKYKISFKGKTYTYDDPEYHALYKLANRTISIEQIKQDYKENIEELKEELKWVIQAKVEASIEKYSRELKKLKKEFKFFNSLSEKDVEEIKYVGGQVHKIELPEDEFLLDEQKLYTQQSPYVKKALKKLFASLGHDIKEILYTGYVKHNATGSQLYDEIMSFSGGEQKSASLKLYEFGIKGITYDGQHDGRCYVIFNPDDVKVVDKLIKEAKVQDKTDNQAQIDGVWYNQKIIDNLLGSEAFNNLQIGDEVELEKDKPQPKSGEYILNNNFWAWFGDSKVRDEEGNPLVVYHGSEYDISKFIKDYSGATTGNNYAECFYFTSDKDSAIDYSVEATVRSHENEFYDEDWCNELSYDDYANNIREKVRDNPHINPCFLKMENPFIYDNQHKEFDYMKIYTMEMVLQGRSDEHQLFDEDTYYEMLDYLGHYDEESGDFIENNITYDGLIIKNVVDDIGDFHGTIDEYIVWNPNQIKSVNNKGNWSLYSDNVNEALNEQVLNERLFPEIPDDKYADLLKDTSSNGKANAYTKFFGQYLINNHLHKDEDIAQLTQRHQKLYQAGLVKPIMDYKDIFELIHDLNDHNDYETKSEKSKDASKGLKFITDINNYKMYEVNTYEAAVKYGKGTKWCVASKNNSVDFNSYTDSHNNKNENVERHLYYLLPNDKSEKIAVSISKKELTPKGIDVEERIYNSKKYTKYGLRINIFNEQDGIIGDFAEWINAKNEYGDDANGTENPLVKKIIIVLNNILNLNIKNKNVLNEQVAYHGTLHNHDKFSTNKIGSGNTGQTHGWGLYFTSSKKEAEDYKNRALKYTALYNGQPITEKGSHFYVGDTDVDTMSDSKDLWNLLSRVTSDGKSYTNGIKWQLKYAKERIESGELSKGDLEYYTDLIKSLKNQVKLAKNLSFDTGMVYRVELPDDEYLLKEDEHMSGQSPYVYKAIMKLYQDGYLKKSDLKEIGGRIYTTIAYKLVKNIYNDKAYRLASEKLLEYGIKGILSFDIFNGKETKVFCIFSENDVKILDKNSEAKMLEQLDEANNSETIFYHGSPSKNIKEWHTNNIFWTTDREFAETYGRYIYSAKLDLGNTFNILNKQHFDWLLAQNNGVISIPDENSDDDQDFEVCDYTNFMKWEDIEFDNWECVEQYLDIIKTKFDSAVVLEQGTENYVIFSNNQIHLTNDKPDIRRIDENLEHNITLYHASDSKFDNFDINYANTKAHKEKMKGIWLSNSRKYIKQFGKIIYTCKVDNSNILNIDSDKYDKIINHFEKKYNIPFDLEGDNTNKAQKYLIDNGYTGIYFEKEKGVYVYVIFDANIIKIIGNKQLSETVSYDNLSESIYHTTMLKNGDMFEVHQNPTKKEFWDLLNRSEVKDLRGVLGINEPILYVWDSYYGTHKQIFDSIIGKDWKEEDYVGCWFRKDDMGVFGFSKFTSDIKEKYYGKEPEKPMSKDNLDKIIADDDLGLLNEEIVSAQSNYGELYLVIYKNPTRKELSEDKYQQFRIVEDDYGNWYFGNAHDFVHQELFETLKDKGIEFSDWTDYNIGFNVMLYDNKTNTFIYRADIYENTEKETIKAKQEVLNDFKQMLSQKYGSAFGNYKVCVSSSEEPWLDYENAYFGQEQVKEAYVQVDKPIGNTGMTYNADYIEFEPEMRFIDEYDVEWTVEQVKGDNVLMRTKNNQIRVDTAENLNLDIFALDKLKPVFDERFYTQSDLERE